ncbi:MAG: SurA N-terminal domain-containing protein [Holosporaceae bacterium]|jgi:peptidyl-prolyl cis-trans isomerase D|nr:SurA N-terminal domain-containing protein [Holosporaceae bacterium]
MLAFIRKHSNSVIVKIFLIILALSFVLFFGISSIIRKISGKDYVIKIGKIQISPIDFKTEKAKRLGMLKLHDKNTDEKILTTNIIHQLIWENIVDQASKEYKIVVSDDTIKKYISGMNVFLNKDGSFNANLLRGFLQRIQVPEAMFLELSKKDIKSALIKAPFAYISTTLESDQFVHANLEKRSVAFVELKPNSFRISEEPSKEMLEEFYTNHPDLFTAEETRSFKILELSEPSLEANIQISDEEIKDAYEHSSEREDRSYNDMKTELASSLKQEKLQSEINDISRQIEDALMAGENILEISKKFNLNLITIEGVDSHNRSATSNDVIKLPYKDDILAVAFSIDEGTESSFSETFDANKNKIYWLLHMDSITPKHVVAFEKISDKVVKEWTLHKQDEKIQALASDFIEKIKKGDGLKNLALKNDLPLKVTPLFDRKGTSQDKTKPTSIINEIYENVFSMGKAEAASHKETNGTIVVYSIQDIVSPKEVDKKDEEKYSTELRSEIIEDMYQQLVGYLSKKYEIKINHELLKEINEEVNQNIIDEVF